MEDDTIRAQNTMGGEEIVVTGISGIFPNSESVQEFMQNLYDKVDMVSDDPKCTINDPEVPKYTGKVKGTEKFDSMFFKVGYQQASVLEPMSRKLLEHAYGAIFDSGNTHATLKGKIIGVFIGSSYADFSATCMYDLTKYSEFMVGGSSKSMLANRISYWVDGKGPSYCVDYSCASSIAALELAYKSMNAGDCDAAVVGGCNLCNQPALSLNLKRAGLLCMDGKTKCFDKNGDGYVRSDATSLIFLQKAKDAKRVYAELYYAHGTYQLKDNDRFLPLRKSEDIQTFLNDVYSKTDIHPENIEYVEANAAGLAEADKNEVKAIANVFGKDKVVKLGSVKSNMGHSESASGLCALTKLCLAYHKGEIPANLHYNDPVDTAIDEKIQVVTENTKFERGYTALNSLSLTGANFHVVLKGHYKKKNLESYNSRIPRIVLASGRQESCVSRILDDLKSKQVDAEEIALLHNIFQSDIVEHTGRGYTVLDTIEGNTVTLSESVDYYQGVRPPLWFVYSGMGSQWAGMGADLMRIPQFAAAIERCNKILLPIGIDIVKVLTEPDNKIFDNILHSFVGISAVQIGLTDILKEMGLAPDFIIGHSLGEMACAYHDNTFTTEEMILSTYSRGKSIQDVNLVKGSMAAVGLGYKDLVNQCPPEIDVACRNSSESSTLSGPVEIMKKFVDDLTNRGIFARAVPSANVAYHSRYIADAAPVLLSRLKEIIKNPKPRSQRWISSSVPKEKWDEPEAKYSSAEYHTNNLLVSAPLTANIAYSNTAVLLPGNINFVYIVLLKLVFFTSY